MRRLRKHPLLVLVIAILAVAGIALLVTVSNSSSPRQKTVAHTPPPPTTPSRPTLSNQAERPLLGITEENANLLLAPGASTSGIAPVGAPDLSSAFASANNALSALRPSYVRLLVYWTQLQPREDQPPTFAGTVDGCSREQPPCSPYLWLKAELQAIKTRQEEGSNVQPVLNIYGTPAWAAAPQTGCSPPGATKISAPLNAAGLAGYEQLIKSVLALGKEVGVALPYWTAWNEPNGTFITPQRARCETSSPALAPADYAKLVEAMQSAFSTTGDEESHQILLGELVGVTTSSPNETSISEFINGLPEKVVCASKIWTVHDYATWGRYKNNDPVPALEAVLDKYSCASQDSIWVTETGAGGELPGGPRGDAPNGAVEACKALNAKMESYLSDPRVAAVFQYSFRDDKDYPVGLENAALTQLYPTYYLWLAWTQRTTTAPPPLPIACA